MKLFNKLTSYIRGEDLDETEEISESTEKSEFSDRQDREREREKKSASNLTPFRLKRSYSPQRNSDANNKSQDIIIFSPCDVTEAASVCNYLRENKICIIDLQGVEPANAQRIADFLSGAAYIVDGDIQRVSSEIFLVAPASVTITGEFKEKLKENGLILPWVSQSFK